MQVTTGPESIVSLPVASGWLRIFNLKSSHPSNWASYFFRAKSISQESVVRICLRVCCRICFRVPVPGVKEHLELRIALNLIQSKWCVQTVCKQFASANSTVWPLRRENLLSKRRSPNAGGIQCTQRTVSREALWPRVNNAGAGRISIRRSFGGKALS